MLTVGTLLALEVFLISYLKTSVTRAKHKQQSMESDTDKNEIAFRTFFLKKQI